MLELCCTTSPSSTTTQTTLPSEPRKTPALVEPPACYAPWLAELYARIHRVHQRAALAVNRELVLLYWHINRDILARQAEQGRGAKVIDRLAHDLRTAFPQMLFSRRPDVYACFRRGVGRGRNRPTACWTIALTRPRCPHPCRCASLPQSRAPIAMPRASAA